MPVSFRKHQELEIAVPTINLRKVIEGRRLGDVEDGYDILIDACIGKELEELEFS